MRILSLLLILFGACSDTSAPDAAFDAGVRDGAQRDVGDDVPRMADWISTLASPQTGGRHIRGGVPFGRGVLATETVTLIAGGTRVPTQSRVLARWDDDSVRWLLVDGLLAELYEGQPVGLVASSSASPRNPVQIETSDDEVVLSNGRVRATISRRDGRGLSALSVDGESMLGEGASGPYIIISRDGIEARYEGRNAQAGPGVDDDAIQSFRAHPSELGYAGSLTAFDPFRLEVVVEEEGPLRSSLRVSSALVSEDGRWWGTSIVRIELRADDVELGIAQTFVTTGDEDDQIAGLGFALPLRGATNSRGANGAVRQILHDRYASHQRDGERVEARNEGWLTHNVGSRELSVRLEEMAEHFPKALTSTEEGVDVELYPRSVEPWNLARYSDVIDRENGETSSPAFHEACNRGAQGIARTHRFRVSFGPAEEPEVSLLPTLESISNTRVMGVGSFGFSPTSSAHRRLDFKLKTIADFMRVNQRSQFLWFGIESYGDIRGRFDGGAMESAEWSERGRYGWSANSGEPSNQLWLEYLRTRSPDVLRDARALARQTMDMSTIHYGSNDVVHGRTCAWDGLNRRFAVGSLHRHGQQAWSGYGQAPEYSHVAGVETYYYLSGDRRALDVLYENAQFIARFASNSPGTSARANGIDVVDRAVALFEVERPSDPALLAWKERLPRMVAALASNDFEAVDDQLAGESLGAMFNFFVRIVRGLAYRHERTLDPGALAILRHAAARLLARADPLGLTRDAESTGLYYAIPLLAYVASLPEGGADARRVVARIAELNAHQVGLSECERGGGASSMCFADEWLSSVSHWSQWSWRWEQEPTGPRPGILWIARQLTFRNDYMQDYHSYRALESLSLAGSHLDR
ncbi:MAG: hypothetical protein AB8H86_17605 [Polyangiales bacterium]